MNKKEETKNKKPKNGSSVFLAIMIVTMLLLPTAYMIVTTQKSNPIPTPNPTPTPIPPYTPPYQIEIPPNATENDTLAINLYNDGWRLFSYSTCRWCAWQKQQFGDAVQYLNIIECFDNTTQSGVADECMIYDIRGFPTWISPNGTQYMGAKDVTQLSEMLEDYR